MSNKDREIKVREQDLGIMFISFVRYAASRGNSGIAAYTIKSYIMSYLDSFSDDYKKYIVNKLRDEIESFEGNNASEQNYFRQLYEYLLEY